MSIVDKMKKLFLEEEEEEIKSEVIKVEIKAPASEIKKEEPKIEEKIEPIEAFKQEVKMEEKKEEKAPVFFDEDYFKEIETPKPDYTTSYKSSYKSSYKKDIVTKEKKEEKKLFKPTPIISPVYGVLDKNYSKEDIVQRKEMDYVLNVDAGVTIDDVRKKAYGTLEDDLEQNLFTTPEKEELFEELIEVDFNDDIIKDEPIDESELFDLIDSIYERGDLNG